MPPSNCSPWLMQTKEKILLNSGLLQFLDVFRETEVRFLIVGDTQ